MKIIESLRQRWVVWVWNHTPNCAEMARLASRSFEQPLPMATRLKMAMHYLICVWCGRYVKHLRFLHAAAPGLDGRLNLSATRGLSAEAKRRIVQRLRAG